MAGSFGNEDIFDPQPERRGDLEGQGERGVEATTFDRDDGLTRHAETLGQFGLCPSLRGAEVLYAVLQLDEPPLASAAHSRVHEHRGHW